MTDSSTCGVLIFNAKLAIDIFCSKLRIKLAVKIWTNIENSKFAVTQVSDTYGEAADIRIPMKKAPNGTMIQDMATAESG